MPNKHAVLKNNTMIYILPTNKSTIFYQLDNFKKVEILNKKNEFIKVMFNNNSNKVIGWVKEDSFVKN